MSSWTTYNEGKTIGALSTDGAVILWDQEHKLGARITLKRSSAYISIACHIYGRTDHTRFFGISLDAEREYKSMRTALGNLMNTINLAEQNDLKIWEAISEFVRRFP